jgi:hypothetical protein
VEAEFEVNNGEEILFWEDIWVEAVPLKLIFPKLYNYCGKKDCSVRECWNTGVWVMNFSRPLSQDKARQWDDLVLKLQTVHLNELKDRVKWVHEKSGTFTTKSMYRQLVHRGFVNRRMSLMWKSKIPMNVKVFMWLACQNKI